MCCHSSSAFIILVKQNKKVHLYLQLTFSFVHFRHLCQLTELQVSSTNESHFVSTMKKHIIAVNKRILAMIRRRCSVPLSVQFTFQSVSLSFSPFAVFNTVLWWSSCCLEQSIRLLLSLSVQERKNQQQNQCIL